MILIRWEKEGGEEVEAKGKKEPPPAATEAPPTLQTGS